MKAPVFLEAAAAALSLPHDQSEQVTNIEDEYLLACVSNPAEQKTAGVPIGFSGRHDVCLLDCNLVVKALSDQGELFVTAEGNDTRQRAGPAK